LAEDTSNDDGFCYPFGGSSNAFSGCQVAISVDQNVTGSTNNIVTFDVSNYDTNGYHSTTTNNSRLTAPAAGYYLVVANLRFTAASVQAYAQIFVNGNALVTPSVNGGSGAYESGVSIAVETHLNLGDYVQLVVYPTSGNATIDHGQTLFSMSLRGT
jgi:hypothetical protein